MVLFSEDHIQETKRRGRIEVICGSMFSGKTEELIRRLKRAKFAKQRVEIYKPAIDTRYSDTLETSSAMAHSPGMGPKGLPRKSISNPATITYVSHLRQTIHG